MRLERNSNHINGGNEMKRILSILAFLFLCGFSLFAQEAAESVKATGADVMSAVKYLSAAIAVGLACLAGGIAVGKIGAAAMGAMSENPELSSKGIPYVGLAEGICLWGALIAVLILVL